MSGHPPATSPLRQARDRLRLSRETVCRLLATPVSTKTLERWEAGLTEPNLLQLEELARIYRRQPERLWRDMRRWQENGREAA